MSVSIRTWFIVLLAAMSAIGCARTSPEQELREAMSALQAGIEARDAGRVDDWLADDFVGPEGLDRAGARRLAQAMFLRHRDVGASLGPVEVVLQQRHATVRFNAALTGGSGSLIPDAARIYDVETGWRLDDGEWRMTSARWTPRL
ncbi:MAG TPA: nuclear transport factor 2 family protein [Lysobacter sp.]